MPTANPFDLTGRNALVTGASRGIGLACARLLGRCGARVTITGRKPDGLRDAAAQLAADGVHARPEVCHQGDWRAIADLFTRLDAADSSPDIVVINAATNPVGALTGLTHGRVCEDRALRRLVSVLVDEGKAVASAQGIELDADPEELIDYAARPEVAYDHKASMLQDVEARRETEIDYLNGGIARFGREHGVTTPTHEAIWALVKGLERSWSRAG